MKLSTWISWQVSFLLKRWWRLLLFSGGTIVSAAKVICSEQLISLLLNFISSSITWSEAPTITTCSSIRHWREEKDKKGEDIIQTFCLLSLISFPTSLLFLSLFLLFLLLCGRRSTVYKTIKKQNKQLKHERWDLLQLGEDKNQEILLHFWWRREFSCCHNMNTRAWTLLWLCIVIMNI